MVRAFPVEGHENMVPPLWTGSLPIVSGVHRGTHRYTLPQTNDCWETTQVWKNTDLAMYMSWPVYCDLVIYGHSA